MRRYTLLDDQWEKIKDLLPGREGPVSESQPILFLYQTPIFKLDGVDFGAKMMVQLLVGLKNLC